MSSPSVRERSDAMTVFLHWGLVLTLLFSLATGLRISADAEDSVWAKALNVLLLQGNVMHWHVWAAYGLAIVAICYVAFMWQARLRARIALDGARVGALGSPDRAERWKAANVVLYWIAFVLLVLITLTGTLMYFVPGVLPHAVVIAVHRAVAWLVMAYVVVHIAFQFVLGGFRQLLKILTPRAAYGAASLMALIISGVVGVGVYALDKAAIQDLRVTYQKTPPIVDGNAEDSAWSNTKSVTIATSRGVNQPGGEVKVRVRMTHDNESLYALFEWPDATRSQKHLPLQKTASGWRVVQTEFDIQDEDKYYEDKFAVMLSTTPELAGAGTTHLGPKPIANRPSPSGGRGLHYTVDGSNVDVWHWKSVRTGNSVMNQIDDNYFGPPLDVNPKKQRYTGGYTQDPKSGGGFKMNWEKFSTATIKPLRLPKDPTMLTQLGSLNLDPNASDDGQFWMPVAHTVAYREELDIYPVGTVMPSVLVDGAFEGDRGDVTAKANWQDGWWRMEVTRKLDTVSEFDTSFSDDRPVYLWVAVFDHAQTRHSIHLHPVRLTLE